MRRLNDFLNLMLIMRAKGDLMEEKFLSSFEFYVFFFVQMATQLIPVTGFCVRVVDCGSLLRYL